MARERVCQVRILYYRTVLDNPLERKGELASSLLEIVQRAASLSEVVEGRCRVHLCELCWLLASYLRIMPSGLSILPFW